MNPKIESIMKELEHSMKTTSHRRYVLIGFDFVMFADSIKKEYLYNSNIVIDLQEEKIIKNRYF